MTGMKNHEKLCMIHGGIPKTSKIERVLNPLSDGIQIMAVLMGGGH